MTDRYFTLDFIKNLQSTTNSKESSAEEALAEWNKAHVYMHGLPTYPPTDLT